MSEDPPEDSPDSAAPERPSVDGWSPYALALSQRFAPLALMAGVFFAMSFLLHFPGMSPNVYSDLMDTLWQRILKAPGIVPYSSYNLEYPAISGIVLYVSSIPKNMYAFYVSMSAILFVCMLASVFIVYKLQRERRLPVQSIAFFVIFTPSFIYFSIYSFDWIGAVFMVASIFFAYKRRPMGAGLSIGLAVAARIIPIVCLPFLLFQFKKTESRLLLLTSAGLSWIAVNAYFMVTNFSGWLYPYTFQASYGVEDSWLGLAAPYDKEVSVALLVTALALILYKREKFNVFEQTLLAMLAFVLFNFKFPPQYMIMLLPLFALAGVGYVEFIVANALNVVVILFYFTPAFNLGDPLLVTSPVQWVAYLRQFVLLVVFAKVLLRRRAPLPLIEKEVQLAQEIPLAPLARASETVID